MATTVSDRKAIIAAMRSVIKDTLALTDSQIILEGVKGYRVKLPYLTIKVLVHGINTEAQDWVEHEQVGGIQFQGARGYREASVSLNGYGEGALVWLEQLVDLMQHNAIARETMKAAGLSFTTVPSITDLTQLLDTNFENRSNMTILVAYERFNPQINEVDELEVVELSVDFTSPTGPSSITMTETVDPENPPC